MKIASVTSPSAADRTPAAASSSTMGDVSWPSRIAPGPQLAPARSSFGPCWASRAARLLCAEPRSGSVPSRAATAAAGVAWSGYGPSSPRSQDPRQGAGVTVVTAAARLMVVALDVLGLDPLELGGREAREKLPGEVEGLFDRATSRP